MQREVVSWGGETVVEPDALKSGSGNGHTALLHQ